MANPILKDDLISQEALDALERMSKLLHDDALAMEAMIRATGQYAGSLGSMIQQQQQDNTALQTYADRIENLENALAKMQKMMAENKATQAALNAEKRKYAKLTDEEAQRVRGLSDNIEKYIKLTNSQVASLKGLASVYAKTTVEIDVQNKSYNELYQTYNAIKDALNKMTVAERTGTEAGKALTAQSLKIHDTLNELQKSTGNYTLQAGKYRAAFDGLGYSFQQILREAPSALNIQQFFLAISNNIPLFMDQLDGYNKKQKEIAESLKILEDEGKKGTEEYAKLAQNVEGWGKHLLKSLLSWQTAIIAITMIVRLYGADIINWVKKLFQGVKAVNNELTSTAAMGKLMADVTKKTMDEAIELDLVIEKLKETKRGTAEWAAGIKTVNKITKENLSTTSATLKDVEKITEAYKKQAEQVAKNQILADMIAKSEANKVLRSTAYGASDYGTAMMTLGLKSDTKEEKEFKKLYESMTKAQSGVSYWEAHRGQQAQTAYTAKGEFMGRIPSGEEQLVEAKKVYDEANQEYQNFINARLQILSPAARKKLEEQFKLIDPLKNSSKNGHTYSLKDVDFLESELLDKDAVIELESNFERRLAMLAKEEEKERQILLEKYQRESKDLEFNREKHLITEAEYQEQRAKLDTNYNNLIKTNYEGNFEEMGVIQRKYWNKRNEITAKEAEKEEKEALKRDKQAIKDIENRYASEYKVVKHRVKTISDEVQKNTDLAFNIGKAKEELAELNQLVIESSEDTSGYTARINELTKAIEKWRSQMDFTKQLSNYKNPWDILQRNGAFNASGDMKKGILGSILGVDTLNGMSEDQIDSAFETWLDNLGSSISTWYNTTMGYINDLIGAYVDLANAKAEAAKEATEAAQEEYDKEKALLEAGYASRVEATWAEYQEKKAAQEQAEKDAKAAAEAQQQLNEISTLGSLVTASANIWKTFTEIPVVGVPLAIAAIGTMFGSFLAAKMKAAQVSQYGEGGFEVLEGGSHASGHDINLGVRNRRGRRMHAEGKEGLAIFSRRAMNHYGTDGIENVVNGINHLEYEQSVGRTLSLQRDMGLHNTMILPRTNLHRLESGVDKLVAIGSNSRYYDPDGTEVITTASGTTRIRRR